MRKIANLNNFSTAAIIVLILVFQLALIKPFFHSGFFPTHDGIQTVRIFEYYKALKYGQTPPRWTSDLLYGHGYPLFVFYGPFTYLIGATFVFLGANFLVATKIVFVLGFAIGALGIFFLIKYLVGNWAALVCSILYSLIPYRAVDVYVRGDLPEFLAFSFFPWILLVNIRLLQSPINFLLIIIFSLLSSILVITHNLAAAIYTFFLLPFNLFYVFKYQKNKFLLAIKAIIVSGVLSLLLTSFYWLPLLIESNFVQLDKFAQYPYSNYFLSLKQIWQSTWGYGGFLEKNPMSLQFGQVILVLSILTNLLNIIIKTKLRPLILFLGIALLCTVILETKLSQLLWDNLIILHYFQFPWRLHLLNTIISVLLVGFFFYLLSNTKKLQNNNISKIFTFLVGALIIFLSIKESLPFFQAKSFSDETAVSETTTWNDEYMPKWVKSKPTNWAPDKIMFLGIAGKLENIEWGYNQKKFTVTVEKKNKIKIAQVFYPGWWAYINNQRVNIEYDNEQGLMVIDIPEGRNDVAFIFKSIWWRTIADTVSLATFSIMLMLLLYTLGKKYLCFLNK